MNDVRWWMKGKTARLFGSQSDLGVNGLVRGFVSKQWIQRQQEHLMQKEIEPKYNKNDGGKIWGIASVLFQWKRCHTMWKGRNEMVRDPKRNRDDIEMNVKERYEQPMYGEKT
jgi:hypothetical protein